MADFFASLAAQSSLLYFCYRPADGRALYVSPAYEAVLGGQAARVNEELPAWWEALHPDDRAYLRAQQARLAQGQALQGAELRLQRPDGSTRWLRLTAGRYVPAGEALAGEVLVSGYVEDITQQKNLLDHAQRYQAKKDSLLEILSHDLAAPLALTEQVTDYLLEKVVPLADAQLDRLLRDMRAASQEGLRLLRDFVAQEFRESIEVEMNLERVDLAAWLQVVVDNYQQRQHAAGHAFFFESSHPSSYARVDVNKFLQVINNLISNALKFTPDGGHIRVSLSQHPHGLQVRVADNGVGIPAALQAGLFERYTPAARAGLRGEPTTGLGLSIIKTIVEWHQGHIQVESQEGVGTTFTIELPLPAA